MLLFVNPYSIVLPSAFLYAMETLELYTVHDYPCLRQVVCLRGEALLRSPPEWIQPQTRTAAPGISTQVLHSIGKPQRCDDARERKPAATRR